MNRGSFSISLAVMDIEASKAIYEKFGFVVFRRDIAQKLLIMKNGDHVIGTISSKAVAGIINPQKHNQSRHYFSPDWLIRVKEDVSRRPCDALDFTPLLQEIAQLTSAFVAQ